MRRDIPRALLLRASAPPGGGILRKPPRSFGPEDDAYLSRFSDEGALLLRLQARALLERGLETLGMGRGAALLRSPAGAPLLQGAALSLSYTERAWCLLCPAGPGDHLRVGLDCEARRTDFLPPASVLSPAERELNRDGNGPRLEGTEPLRRWCVREAVLKAHGAGLRLPPSSVDAGPPGRRRGECSVEGSAYAWRTVPMQGTWVCVAADAAHAGILDEMEVESV